jgi:hypothetical protein
MHNLFTQIGLMIGALSLRQVVRHFNCDLPHLRSSAPDAWDESRPDGRGLVAFGLRFYQFSIVFNLTTVEFLVRTYCRLPWFVQYSSSFNTEIRGALTQIGNNLLLRKQRNQNPFGEEWYDEVVLAATTLSSEKTGATHGF